jgi:hypothetical protein
MRESWSCATLKVSYPQVKGHQVPGSSPVTHPIVLFPVIEDSCLESSRTPSPNWAEVIFVAVDSLSQKRRAGGADLGQPRQ